jgi:hypothetical protein
MSKQRYCELIDQLCERFSIPDPKSMHDACYIEIEGVYLTLLHGDFVDDDSLIIYCDFGEIPAGKRQAILENLMELNLAAVSNSARGFGYNPETGHVMMLTRLPLSQTTLDVLVPGLAEMTIYALTWRDSYFLAPPEIDGRLETVPEIQSTY